MKKKTCFDENDRRGGNLQYQKNLQTKLDIRMSRMLFLSVLYRLSSIESMQVNLHRTLTKKQKKIGGITMKEKFSRLFKTKIFISTLILAALMGFCFVGPIWTSWVPNYHCSTNEGVPTGSCFFETNWSPWAGAHSDGFCLNPGRLLLGATSSYYGSQGTACYTSSSLTESMDNQRIVMGGEYTGNFKIILWCPGYHRISFDHGNETYSPTFTISDADENNFNQNSGYPLPGGARYFERHRMMYGHKDGHTISKHLFSTPKNFCYLGTPFNNRHLDSESLLFKNNGSSPTEIIDNQKFVTGVEYTGDLKINVWCLGYQWISCNYIDYPYSSTVTISDTAGNNFSQNPGYPLPGGGYYFEPHLIMNVHNDVSTITKHLLSTTNSSCYLGTPFEHRHSNYECLLFKTNGISGIKNANNKKSLIGTDCKGDLKSISWNPEHHPVCCDNNGNSKDIYDNYFTTVSDTHGSNVSPNPGNPLPVYSSYIEHQWISRDTDTYGFKPVRRPVKSPIFFLGAYNSSSTHYCHLDQKWTQASNTCSVVFTEMTDNLKFVKGGENANNLKFIEPIMVKKDRECFNEIVIT